MNRSVPEVGTRLPESTAGPFTGAELAAYAQISGDANPLHLDSELARKVGLAAPPVHGMLLLAAFEPALQKWRPDLRIARLSGRFTHPVLEGEPVTLSGRVVRVSGGDVFLVAGRHVVGDPRATHGERHVTRAGDCG